MTPARRLVARVLGTVPWLLVTSIVWACALVILGSTAARAQAAPADDGLDAVTLQLKWKHQFQFAGYYAAIEKGYYRDAGLAVTLREAPEGIEPAQVVLRGEADFGIAGSDLIVLRSEGQPVVALAAIYQHSPLVMLASTEAGIDSVHALDGKRVMLEPHAAELLAYIESEGMSPKRIHFLPHTFDPSSLIDGKVDAISAYATDESFLLQRAGFSYATLNPRAGGIDFYGDTLFTTQDQLVRRPKRVKAFLDASLAGWAYALEHADEIIELILTKYSKRHSKEHLEFEAQVSRTLILPDVVELGYMNPGRWQHIAETYTKLGMMTSPPSLQGFLYQRETKRNLRGLYMALGVSFAILAVVGAIAIRFYRLSERVRMQAESLQLALDEIKVLKGIIPICAHCKKIRDDKGYWTQLERYISDHSEALFSHGICEDCEKEHFPEDEGATGQQGMGNGE